MLSKLKGKGFKTRLKRPLDTLWDLKLGITTWGSWNATVTGGMAYEPASYSALKYALDKLEITEQDVFFDLGCGLARPLFFVDYCYKPKRCVGVEANPQLVELANQNIAHYRYNRSRIDIQHVLAQDADYSEATIIYLYNPFTRNTVVEVLEKIRQSIIANPRKVKIVYLNPIDDTVLRECDWLTFTGQVNHEAIKSLHIGQQQTVAVTYYQSNL